MTATENKTHDLKFLHLLTPVSANGYSKEYEVAGALWRSSSYLEDRDELTRHLDDSSWVVVRHAGQGDDFSWSWTKLLAEGCYARHSGKAETVEEAAAAAMAYAPRVLTFDYITETTWYETAEGRFTAVLDGEPADIFKSHSGDGYRWEREWAPSKTIMSAFSGYFVSGLAGNSATPEEAMIASIEAPNRLKAACATLIANLREQSAVTPCEEPTC